MKKITIIIPNYNGMKFLPSCLEALSLQTCQDFDLLVVDNGSRDGSAQWLKEQGIQALLLPENRGFAGGVNAGLRIVHTPYVILLNNDTEAEPAYVEKLLEAIERSDRIFSVSPKMLQMYSKDQIDDAGDMYSVMGWAYQRGVGQKAKRYNRPCPVFSACAGAAIYRRKVFDQIGYFDELHFAYLEDIDVGYRAKIEGYYNLYCPEAVVYHVGSGTSGSKYNSFKVRLAARNNIYLNYKNMPLFQLLANGVPILAGTAVKYGFFRKIGFGKEYLAGVWEGLSTARRAKRVPYRRENLENYLAIQWELMAGALIYVYEFARRRADKLGKKEI